MNYVPQTESDDLLYSGRRGMPGWDGRHHGAVHSQVESSLQNEENSKTFRGQTRPAWRGQGETIFQSGHYMYGTIVQGYKAITGKDPPFINMCWWINDFILPELTVYRGETYFFKVQGGDSEALGAQNYHPFYITSDPNGGYGRKLGLERGQYTVQGDLFSRKTGSGGDWRLFTPILNQILSFGSVFGQS